MPPEDKMFFTLFQDSAEVCRKSAKLYKDIMETHLTEQQREDAFKYKKRGKRLFKLTLKQLNKSFITPIEREDIQYLALRLFKINKRIIKACLNLEVYNLIEYTEEMKEQASVLAYATEDLEKVVKKFKKVSDVEDITRLNLEMSELESQGDNIHRRALRELFSGQYEALEVLKLRVMYADIEKALDSCFHVSDTILNIVLKQS
jgi:uncharacterized protein Yka (UPF0111/DUF47 family)